MKPLSPSDQKLLDHLTAIFAEHGGSMTQQKFDSVFGGFLFGSTDGAHWQGWNGDNIIWGDMGGGDWAKWLDLLQYAYQAGLASTEGKVPNLVYHLPAKATTP